ncbi:MAG TPA: HlyD family secretion protein [Acidobacteriaceae bacterium]|nr:HlyD family secretion protein [Acidobacteriaceae bacterium]
MAEQNPEERGPGENDQRDPERPEVSPSKTGRRRFVIIGVVAVLVVGAILFWWHSTYYEDTDDAQVDGHLVQISARVAGQVIKVNVEVNQYVQAGTVLAEVDPRDFQVAEQQSEANLASAEASYEAAKVNVPIIGVNTNTNLASATSVVSTSSASVQQAMRQLEAAQASVAQAVAANVKAQSDLKRFTPLVEKDVISKQQYDAVVAQADASAAAVLEAKANAIAAEDAVRIARDRVTQSQAQLKYAQTAPDQVKATKAKADEAAAMVQQARAQLAQARLNLSYTKIVAPVSGIITKKSLEISQNVSVGQNMMTLVSLEDVWITANFKETQLREMRPGQKVKIHVDAYGRDYDGSVTQIGGATGSVLSLFPPENATGNYVKVVQRVPVRIDLTNRSEDQDHLLRPGLSVEPTVRIKN